ncbi:lytic transglycosylase domain-containing protein [Paenibacillus chitinolyticus]|uniref:lytic transglycosylase domain-containing protein n=1 Tax=Paenibacillus chitinolyticus TaxID=79263 RepID=UPI00366F2308
MKYTGKLTSPGASGIPQAYRGIFSDVSSKTGIDVNLLGAIAKAESSFNQNSKSHVGATGLMQLMPATAKSLGVNPNDPAQNVLGGATYIGYQLKKYGNVQLALAAYNAGPGNVDKAIKKAGSREWNAVSKYLPKETQNYVPKVMSNMGR